MAPLDDTRLQPQVLKSTDGGVISLLQQTGSVGLNGNMNQAQIRDLHNRGHIIGSHSCSHPERMSHLAPQDVRREWEDSCKVLSEIVQCPVRTASVAGGYYSRSVVEAAASVGIEVLFNSEPVSGAALVNGCLVLGRYSIQSLTSPKVSSGIAAAHRWPSWKQGILWNAKRILKTMGGESYVTVRRQLLSIIMPRRPAARE